MSFKQIKDYDIDNVMHRRACSGYSIESGKNLQLLSEEYDSIMINNHDIHEELIKNSQDLFRLWSLMSRIESTITDSNNFNYSTNSLYDLNDFNLLNKLENDLTIDNIYGTSNTTKLNIYLSNNRIFARKLCGWVDINDIITNNKLTNEQVTYDNTLDGLVLECEQINFERASTLALLHGDLSLSVRILQDTIDKYTIHRNNKVDISLNDDLDVNIYDDSITDSYISIISIVAMCLAGYNHNNNNDLWINMCDHTIKQLESINRLNTNYLIFLCKFLIISLDKNNISLIDSLFLLLTSSFISLDDKIGFASTYLPINLLIQWLKEELNDCVTKGRLDGLLICGLSKDSLVILQRYLDLTSDIQTCALLSTNRLILSSTNKSNYHSSIEYQWLYEYKQLLNKWQLFMERTKLDVSIGKQLRENQIETSLTNQSTIISSANRQSSNIDTKNKSSNKRQLYILPHHIIEPHLLLRCHYCGNVLPLDISQQQQQQATTAFLRKQKPIMNCCASCKRQLPKCYVCQLYLGLANPNLEFQRLLILKRQSNDKKSNDYTEQNVLDIGQWFFFCQRCKHGGHANCIEEWFESSLTDHDYNHSNGYYRSCGVNGCFCPCTMY